MLQALRVGCLKRCKSGFQPCKSPCWYKQSNSLLQRLRGRRRRGRTRSARKQRSARSSESKPLLEVCLINLRLQALRILMTRSTGHSIPPYTFIAMCQCTVCCTQKHRQSLGVLGLVPSFAISSCTTPANRISCCTGRCCCSRLPVLAGFCCMV